MRGWSMLAFLGVAGCGSPCVSYVDDLIAVDREFRVGQVLGFPSGTMLGPVMSSDNAILKLEYRQGDGSYVTVRYRIDPSTSSVVE